MKQHKKDSKKYEFYPSENNSGKGGWRNLIILIKLNHKMSGARDLSMRAV
jgi:hypothetical protein